MKYAALLIVLSCVLGSCANSGAGTQLSNRVIEYPLQGDQYVVVIVMDGITKKQAEQLAKKKAAETTVRMGDRYFSVDKMYETQVIQSSGNFNESQQFYGNMYQELIIERGFDRDRLSRPDSPNANVYQAIRLEFTTYKNKPGLRAIDACTLTECN